MFRHPVLHISLQKDWLATVYEKGLAIIGQSFILHAEACSPEPDGCEWAYLFLSTGICDLKLLGPDAMYCVKFAGSLFWGVNLEEAYECAIEQFTRALIGNQDERDHWEDYEDERRNY